VARGTSDVTQSDKNLHQENTVHEERLIAALRAGEEWAIEAVIRTAAGRLLAAARRLCRDEEDARGAVRSGLSSAFRSFDQFGGGMLIDAWLYRIVVDTAMLRLRSQRRIPEQSIAHLLPAFHDDGRHMEPCQDWGLPADRLLERDGMAATVRACVARLPEIHRTVLVLRDIEELSAQEVADALGTTAPAVNAHLHQARQALSTLLRKQFARQSLV